MAPQFNSNPISEAIQQSIPMLMLQTMVPGAAEEAAASAKTTVAVGESIVTRMNLANEKERIAILQQLDELQDRHVKRCKQCTTFGGLDPACAGAVKLIQRTDKSADRIM